jgi:hypothetical protein
MRSFVGGVLPTLRRRVAVLAVIGPLVAVTAVATFGVGRAAAANTSAPSASAGAGRNCTMVIDKLQPGETVSKVRSYTCAAPGQPAPAPDASIEASTQLMLWCVDWNWGSPCTFVYGTAGPCDATGYGISYVGNVWNDVISSFLVYNNCWYTRAYIDSNYGGGCQDYSGDVSYVGDFMNDRISSFRIAAWRRAC